MKKLGSGILVIVSVITLASCGDKASFYSNLQRSDLFTQEYNDSKFDFLWVMDNSASMQPRREYVKDNMQTFLNILNSRKAIDFQMAVTITDLISNQGQLIASAGGLEVVKSATSADPVNDFASIVDAVGYTPTSYWEQGLEAGYQALSNYKSQFSRTGVPLIIIILSDADDYSCQNNCTGNPRTSPGPGMTLYTTDRYVSYFTSVKTDEGSSTYVFPIVGLSTANCSVISDGARYQTVQVGVGGLGTTGSICMNDMQSSYENIAQVIANRGMVFTLSKSANPGAIAVYVDNQLIPASDSNYTYDATQNAIVFTGMVPKNGSVIQVDYNLP